MDLSNLSVGELRNLQDQIKIELKKREQHDLAKAREQILSIAQSVGIPIKDLISSGIRTKSGAVAVKYRNPNDASQQWTGRGRKPKWVEEMLKSGASMASMMV